MAANAKTLKAGMSENDILEEFGIPYWIDRDEETILFYEYRAGNMEVQFEISEEGKLEFIILSVDGVLSSAEQRKAYGVDKDWPPNSEE